MTDPFRPLKPEPPEPPLIWKVVGVMILLLILGIFVLPILVKAAFFLWEWALT